MYRYKVFVWGRFYAEVRANSPRLAERECERIYGIRPTFIKCIGRKS